jgi:transcriptional regulator with XRE-family HTH domain
MTGPQLRTIRVSLNLTQVQFADLLGVHPITVSKYETMERPIPRTVIHLAELLKEKKTHETIIASDHDC